MRLRCEHLDGTVVDTLVTTRAWLELDRQDPDGSLSGPARVCFAAWWMLTNIGDPAPSKAETWEDFADEWAIEVSKSPGPK